MCDNRRYIKKQGRDVSGLRALTRWAGCRPVDKVPKGVRKKSNAVKIG